MDDLSPAEKSMFGGLGFMVAGKMAIATSGQGGALVRSDPDQADELCARDGVERMVMGGKPMSGWLRVDSVALDSDLDLQAWINRGVAAAAAAAS